MQSATSDKEIIERIIGERQASIFGERYRGACLSKIELGGHAEKVNAFCKLRRNFLIYCGNPGIGKTYFCAAMYAFIFKNFNSIRYWHEAELLKRVRSSMEECKGDYLEALKWLVDDEFVMIDDIGSSGLNDWRREIIFETINLRYNSMKPTILTSNFSVREFKEYFHERVASRLFAKENYVVEILDGDDRRSEGL